MSMNDSSIPNSCTALFTLFILDGIGRDSGHSFISITQCFGQCYILTKLWRVYLTEAFQLGNSMFVQPLMGNSGCVADDVFKITHSGSRLAIITCQHKVTFLLLTGPEGENNICLDMFAGALLAIDDGYTHQWGHVPSVHLPCGDLLLG